MEKKDLNEILNRMKNASIIEIDDSLKLTNKANITDFTPKKKPSLKDRFKNSINSIKKSKFLMKIKMWFNKTIVNPIKSKKAKRDHNRYVKELKANFAKKFNVDVEKTINIMNSPGYSPVNVDNNQLLVQNRLEINKRKSLYTFAPFIYDVDIVDIHNENLNSELPPVNEIIAEDNKKASKTLDKQHMFFVERPKLTKKKIQRKN